MKLKLSWFESIFLHPLGDEDNLSNNLNFVWTISFLYFKLSFMFIFGLLFGTQFLLLMLTGDRILFLVILNILFKFNFFSSLFIGIGDPNHWIRCSIDWLMLYFLTPNLALKLLDFMFEFWLSDTTAFTFEQILGILLRIFLISSLFILDF